MPIALQRNLVSTYEMVQFHNIAARSNEPHIPANTLSKSISLAIETFHRILYLYLQSGARRLSYLRETLDAAIRKGRLLLDKDLRDWEDYLTTRLFTSLPLTSFVGTMQFIIHFIFVDCIKNLCVVPKTPVDIPDEQVSSFIRVPIRWERSGATRYIMGTSLYSLSSRVRVETRHTNRIVLTNHFTFHIFWTGLVLESEFGIFTHGNYEHKTIWLGELYTFLAVSPKNALYIVVVRCAVDLVIIHEQSGKTWLPP